MGYGPIGFQQIGEGCSWRLAEASKTAILNANYMAKCLEHEINGTVAQEWIPNSVSLLWLTVSHFNCRTH
nr:glycine dehydrogenase (decarboxylating) 1, mitochondrial [Quercus suber]